MKEKLINVALLVTVLFASCVNSVNESNEAKYGNLRINFSYEESRVPMTKSGIDLLTLAKSLTLFVVGGDGQVVQTINQNTTQTGYGTIELTLPYGSYSLVGVAHNGEQASYSDGVITYANDKVTDSFIGKLDVTINQNAPSTTTIELERKVAKLTVKMKDEVPSHAKEVIITIDGYSSGYNVNQANGTVAKTLTRTYDITEHIGETDLSISIYTYLPSSSHKTNVDYTIKDKSDAVIFNQQISNVSLVECTQTIISGNFFTDQNRFSVSLSGDWKTPIDIDI